MWANLTRTLIQDAQETPLYFLAMVENITESKQIEFIVNDNCTGICMDRQLLRHILTNLISNAIKYSPKASPVSVTLNCENNQAIFSIKDRGIDIPPPKTKRDYLKPSTARSMLAISPAQV